MCLPGGRREVSRIWSAMRVATTSCRFQRELTCKQSMRSCERTVSAISNASWLGAPILLPRVWQFERSHLGPLPAHAPDLGPVAEVLVHSTGRVRFQTNDYSVPIQYAYQRLTLKADPFRVRVFVGKELVADHPRCYEKRQVIEDWRHYIPLLLQKSFAVPWASALRHGGVTILCRAKHTLRDKAACRGCSAERLRR